MCIPCESTLKLHPKQLYHCNTDTHSPHFPWQWNLFSAFWPPIFKYHIHILSVSKKFSGTLVDWLRILKVLGKNLQNRDVCSLKNECQWHWHWNQIQSQLQIAKIWTERTANSPWSLPGRLSLQPPKGSNLFCRMKYGLISNVSYNPFIHLLQMTPQVFKLSWLKFLIH